MTLPNTVFFPQALLPLHIFEPRYRAMIADALDCDRLIAMALLRPNQELAYELANEKRIVFACGRYEGIDQRFIDAHVDLQISLGDFVLSGGELAAMALLDAVARFPGAGRRGASGCRGARDGFGSGRTTCRYGRKPRAERARPAASAKRGRR